jgi:predicted PurR-regulated permease PerM
VLKLEVSARAVLFAVLGLIAVWALLRLWPIVVILSTALILMAALLPFVEWQVARRIPRTAAVVVIMAMIFAALAGMLVLVVPATVDELSDLRRDLPEDARDMDEFLGDFGIETDLESRARTINWDRVISGETAVDYGQRALSVGLALLTILFLTAYLLADAPRMNRFLYQFVSPGYEPEVERWLGTLRQVVGGYVRGQVITTVVISVYTFIVLTAVGVPNAAAFAILAGFFDIIPVVGAAIAVLMPTVAAFQESPTQAIIVLVLLMLYQQFEDRLLAPRVYGATMNLPPVAVLVAVLIGGQLFGIAGVLLAMPAAATARVGLDYYLEKRATGQTGPTVGGEEVMAPDVKEEEHG